MENHLINFEKIDWTYAGTGIRYKAYVNENQRLRLVEFSEGFEDADWCKKGHVGYVLDGEYSTDYNGKIERYKKGDMIFISSGENDKHKAILGKGEKALVLLFELV